jgi:hypothetical protein
MKNWKSLSKLNYNTYLLNFEDEDRTRWRLKAQKLERFWIETEEAKERKKWTEGALGGIYITLFPTDF